MLSRTQYAPLVACIQWQQTHFDVPTAKVQTIYNDFLTAASRMDISIT